MKSKKEEYKENILTIINYLNKVNCTVKFNTLAFEDNSPSNMVGHIAYALGHGTKEHVGRSIYDYIQYRTNLTLIDISNLNRCKTTREAAKFLKEIMEKIYEYS